MCTKRSLCIWDGSIAGIPTAGTAPAGIGAATIGDEASDGAGLQVGMDGGTNDAKSGVNTNGAKSGAVVIDAIERQVCGRSGRSGRASKSE